MSRSRVTIRDVAREAQVSLGTASQALSNKPGVAPDTRVRVMEVAAALGYQQQIRVSSPVAAALSTVGILIKQDAGGPLQVNSFYSYVLAGAERECQCQGLSLMYANLEVDECNRALSWPPMLNEDKIDGILVVGAFLEDTISQIRRRAGQRIVLVDAYAPGQQFDSVVTDNLNGAYHAVDYLISGGHTHIGLIGSAPDAYPSIDERRTGYIRALKHHRLPLTYIEDGQLTREEGFQATLRLLHRAPEVTAVFACNDNVALGVMNAAAELGRHIPDDLSVIGFDNIDLAQEVSPPLTTVHVDKTLMGVLAVRRLHERAEHPDQVAVTTALSTQLILRGTARSRIP